jgi:hypothetical protein
MSKSAPAPLAAPTISRKGEAVPAVTSLEPASPIAASATEPLIPTTRLSSRVQATIAVTVRLDEPRYERMKTWGTARRVTNQEVIVAALDQFFRMDDGERESLIANLKR